MGACPRCGHETIDAQARFCAVCGTPLEVADSHDVRKTVTVIFSDVKGSVALGEKLDPEALTGLMNRYFNEMKSVIERHGGSVEKYIGDAVKAVFGMPRAHEDDALRAVRAAIEMRTVLQSLNREFERDYGISLEVRTGVNTGSVLAEESAELRTLPLGDAINVGARLEQAAQAGEILIGAETFRLVRDAVQVEPVELELKGKSSATSAYRVIDVNLRAPGVQRHLERPLVGRNRELALMLQMFEHAREERSCHLFTLLGTAGVGKSRLCLEFERTLQDATVLHGRCLSYGEGITFWPLVEVIQEAAGVGDDDSAEVAAGKIANLVRGDERAKLITNGLAQVSGLVVGAAGIEEIFFAVRRFFEILGKTKPLVVVVDDIHWAEPKFLDLLEQLASWTRGATIFLVCLARPELLDDRPHWAGGQVNSTTIRLEPLKEQGAAEMLTNLLRGGAVDSELRDKLMEMSGRHPLFLEEMVAMLIDNGSLRRDNGTWQITTALEDLAVPTTIEALLTARLDGLSREERLVLERGAIGGQVFSQVAVEYLSPSDLQPQAVSKLRDLVGKDLVQPAEEMFAGGDTFRFRHILIRDAVYEAIPKKVRAELHQSYARWLESASESRPGEYEEILAHHLEQAALLQRELHVATDEVSELAADRLAAAGRKALGRLDGHAAVNFLQRALALQDRSSPTGVALLIDLGNALFAAADVPEAETVLTEAFDRAEALPIGENRREHLRARALIHKLLLKAFTEKGGRFGEIEAAVTDTLPALEAAEDYVGLAVAWHVLGTVRGFAGRDDEAIDAYTRSLTYAEAAGDPYWQDATRTRLLFVRFWGPTPYDEVIEAAEAHLAWAEHSGLAGRQVAALTIKTYGLLMQEKFAEARATSEQARTLARDFSHRGDYMPTVAAATLEQFSGNPREAERSYRQAYEVLEARGEKGLLSSTVAWIAQVVCDQGRYEEAYPWTERGEREAADEDVHAQAYWRLMRARVLASRGDFDEAERLAREGLEILGDTFLIFQPDAWMTFAEILDQAGKASEAQEALERALHTAQLKGNILLGRRAQEKLHALR
ncbi:MAG TPA: adenylate/guanylate cyclase domain-containing protein [Actinomycetota bacterium]|nr:adenylate/guanylate cyclase domain-containing protein [Actinomycetota bacterium]